MTKNLDELLEELKGDLARWKHDVAGMREDGLGDLAAKVDNWIKEAEELIARQKKE